MREQSPAEMPPQARNHLAFIGETSKLTHRFQAAAKAAGKRAIRSLIDAFTSPEIKNRDLTPDLHAKTSALYGIAPHYEVPADKTDRRQAKAVSIDLLSDTETDNFLLVLTLHDPKLGNEVSEASLLFDGKDAFAVPLVAMNGQLLEDATSSGTHQVMLQAQSSLKAIHASNPVYPNC